MSDFFLDHLQYVDSATSTYMNQHFIGKGGNGTAFLVTAVKGPFAGTQFVLKVFRKIDDQTRLAAFQRETQVMKEFNHPCVVKIFDEGVFRSRGEEFPFMITEYLPRNARELLSRSEFNRLQSLRIIMNCLSALSVLHEKSFIHRDIKPENIFLTESIAKLGDFGLVKDSKAEDTSETESDTGTQTPGMPFFYRTPEMVERLKNKAIKITVASDIYQMGTVCYELLTGFNPQRRPVHIGDSIELSIRDVQGNNSIAITDTIERMLSTDPKKRPTAKECLSLFIKIHSNFCEQMKAVIGDNV